MAPKVKLPSCGFAVGASKKGELPLRIEKRARGKKVTVIPNVSGNAASLVRALQTLLGVGGTARQAEGFWSVEVQGDQTVRVQKALLDFDCLQGLSQSALAVLKASVTAASGRTELVLERTAATKFLAQTQGTKSLTPAEERRKLLEMEADFYTNYWNCTRTSADDFSDVWDESLAGVDTVAPGVKVDWPPAQPLAELNCALLTLGMLPESGRAVAEFWKSTQLTLSQFRKMALNPGARIIGEDGVKLKARPTNLISRQKLSDFKSGGCRSHFFASSNSVIDDYQKGIVRTREEREAIVAEKKQRKADEPKLEVRDDITNGNLSALISYVAPFPAPATRLDDELAGVVSKRALKRIEPTLTADLTNSSLSAQSLRCRIDYEKFGIDLVLNEVDFLNAPKRDTGGKPLDASAKEELKLEKKFREISGLARRQREGEQLEKLQAEKVARKPEVFEELAMLKLRLVEKELLKVCKRHLKAFQDAFWDEEENVARNRDNDDLGDFGEETQASFGIFDDASVEGPCSITGGGSRLEGRSAAWAGARLKLGVRYGEVAAFAVEVLEGLVRVGWAQPGAQAAELGSDHNGFGYGGTGKRVRSGAYEPYGETFGPGDVLHCEAERDEGRLRIGFAKNEKPLGVAFDVEDGLARDEPVVGVVCGKGFKARLLSTERMPLDEAPGLEGFIEFDPPRLATVVVDYEGGGEEGCLALRYGETLHVSSDNGEGWLFGFFLDPEDPDDGGWFPAHTVKLIDEAWEPDGHEDGGQLLAWSAAPIADANTNSDWAAPVAAAVAVDWGDDVAPPVWGDSVVSPDVGVRSAWCSDAGPKVQQGATLMVNGLDAWLAGLSLQKYYSLAIAWCSEMGAVSLEEVQECWEELADALCLKPLERKRLAKAMAAPGG